MLNISEPIKSKIRQIIRSAYSILVPSGKRILINSLAVKEKKNRELSEKLILSHRKNKILHKKNLLLENERFKIGPDWELKNFEKISKNSDYELEIINLKSQISALNSRIGQGPNTQINHKLREVNDSLKTKLKNAIGFNRTYGVLIKYLSQENNLNTNAFSIISEQNFDYVLAHDILGLFSAKTLAAHFNCPLIVDLVEEHNLMKRSGDFFRKNLSESEATLINNLLSVIVNSAQKQILIGPIQYKKFTENVRKRGAEFLPNYRNAYKSEKDVREFVDTLLEEKIGIGQTFICVPNTILNAVEIKILIGAIAKSGVKLPIVHVGKELADDVRIEVEDYCTKKRVQFHEFGLLDYDHYREILSRALFCSFMTQEAVFNIKYAFPNRLFDAVSTQTPILTSGFVQVGDFVKEKSIGVYVEGKQTITALSAAVSKMVDSHESFKSSLKNVSQSCSWDYVFSKAFKSIKPGKRILIITRKDVRQNQRIRNLYTSFIKKGCHVTVIGGSKNEYNVINRNFYTVPLMRQVTEEDLYAED